MRKITVGVLLSVSALALAACDDGSNEVEVVETEESTLSTPETMIEEPAMDGLETVDQPIIEDEMNSLGNSIDEAVTATEAEIDQAVEESQEALEETQVETEESLSEAEDALINAKEALAEKASEIQDSETVQQIEGAIDEAGAAINKAGSDIRNAVDSINVPKMGVDKEVDTMIKTDGETQY